MFRNGRTSTSAVPATLTARARALPCRSAMRGLPTQLVRPASLLGKSVAISNPEKFSQLEDREVQKQAADTGYPQKIRQPHDQSLLLVYVALRLGVLPDLPFLHRLRLLHQLPRMPGPSRLGVGCSDLPGRPGLLFRCRLSHDVSSPWVILYRLRETNVD